MKGMIFGDIGFWDCLKIIYFFFLKLTPLIASNPNHKGHACKFSHRQNLLSHLVP